MILRKASAFLLSAALAGCAGAPARRNPSDAERAARLEKTFEILRRKYGLPGLAAGVVRDGRLLWSRGFGLADVDGKKPVADRTPFRLASVTKTFTSVLVLQMAAEGKISLDDPAGDVPGAKVRHVLSHSADAPAGNAFHYNHARFRTLGPRLEALSGKTFRRLLEDRVLLPLEMGDTAPGEDPGLCGAAPEDALDALMAARDTRVLMTAAPPHRVDRKNRARRRADAPGLGTAAGGMVSTVRDLAKFAAALDRGRILDEPSQREILSPVKTPDGAALPYGLGWFLQDAGRLKLAWHYGYVPDTASSLFLRVPDRKLTLILLTNCDRLAAPWAEALAAGDVTRHAFAAAFLAAFIEENP